MRDDVLEELSRLPGRDQDWSGGAPCEWIGWNLPG
jgi:hypothetical protein